jgi:hypothetical protein
MNYSSESRNILNRHPEADQKVASLVKITIFVKTEIQTGP